MKIMKVNFDNSQDYSLAYCHQTMEEVAWLLFKKDRPFEMDQHSFSYIEYTALAFLEMQLIFFESNILLMYMLR